MSWPAAHPTTIAPAPPIAKSATEPIATPPARVAFCTSRRAGQPDRESRQIARRQGRGREGWETRSRSAWAARSQMPLPLSASSSLHAKHVTRPSPFRPSAFPKPSVAYLDMHHIELLLEPVRGDEGRNAAAAQRQHRVKHHSRACVVGGEHADEAWPVDPEEHGADLRRQASDDGRSVHQDIVPAASAVVRCLTALQAVARATLAPHCTRRVMTAKGPCA